jgi:hypothetical protein
MGQRRYEQLVRKPAAFQALTSLTVEEFSELLEPFETAFREHMAAWTLEGKRRQNRAYVSYANSPLPTPEERLLFILSYLKENPTQTYHGLLTGMTQGKANMWIHSLLPALRTALREMSVAPARNFAELLKRLEQEPEAEPQEQATEQPAPPFCPRWHRTLQSALGRPATPTALLQRQEALPHPQKSPPRECTLERALPEWYARGSDGRQAHRRLRQLPVS